MVRSESFLIGILRLIGLIPWPRVVAKKRGRPYVYSPLVMLRCFVVRLWLRIPSDNALHSFFLLSVDNRYNARVMLACGLDRIPDRRTLDRRFRGVSSDVSSRIDSMGHLFVEERLVDPYIVCVDSTTLEARRGARVARQGQEEGADPVHRHRHRGRVGEEQDEGMAVRVQASPFVQHGLPRRPALRRLHHCECS